MSVRFGEFRLDGDTRQLFLADREVHLSPKAFELLRMLVEARPKALSKAEVTERLWPATYVSAANLSVLVAEIRRTLRDRPQSPRFVRTVQRFGYAFCASAVEVAASGSSGSLRVPTCWFVIGTRRVALDEGEHVIGRDPRVSVWIDVPGVSRRHARVHIANGQAVLEDLASKNGTWVGGERIGSRTLKNGQEIRIGSALLTFLVGPSMRTTETLDSANARRGTT
jgi:DNA-binding winged helix-turn-helix (wHTH) protein